MQDLNKLWKIFNKKFADTGLIKGAFSAPGRVNLIGEHTDYNEGFVLPMAIEKKIIMLGQLRNDRLVQVFDLNCKTKIKFPLNDLDRFGTKLPDPIFRRARHIITENNRVLTSMGSLKNNHFTTFGQLMIESHQSLRDDYEVSCPELDLLVALALNEEGVLGARMTGTGFGGCTINLAKKAYLEHFIEVISEEYKKKTGIIPEIYISSP